MPAACASCSIVLIILYICTHISGHHALSNHAAELSIILPIPDLHAGHLKWAVVVMKLLSGLHVCQHLRLNSTSDACNAMQEPSVVTACHRAFCGMSRA